MELTYSCHNKCSYYTAYACIIIGANYAYVTIYYKVLQGAHLAICNYYSMTIHDSIVHNGTEYTHIPIFMGPLYGIIIAKVEHKSLNDVLK